MAIEEFKFRGKTLEELKTLSVKEFAALCNSRSRRSLMRIGTDEKLMKKINKMIAVPQKEGAKPKPIRTHLRDTIIIPKMVGLTFGVYNGKEFYNVYITEEMLGTYLGEYALTRKRVSHGKAGIGATKSSTAVASRK